MDSTAPFALKLGSILAAIAGIFNCVAGVIVAQSGKVMPLIWIGRGSANAAPEPSSYFTYGAILIAICPVLWLVANKIDD